MKILFLTLIALVIPLFFVLMFVQGTYSRLAALRARCRSTWESAAAKAGSAEALGSLEEYRKLVAQYESLRTSIPTRWVARVFAFEKLELTETPQGYFRRAGSTQ